VPSGRHYSHYQ